MQRILLCFLAVFVPAAYAFAEKVEEVEGDIRDIRPPVSFTFDPLTWMIISFLCVSLGFFIFLVYRHIKIKQRAAGGRPVEPPWDIALDRLMTLRYQDFPKVGKVEQYYTQLSEIFRDYIESRFEVNAPDMTTEEFLQRLKSFSELPDKYKNEVEDFLIRSDMAKFACAPVYEDVMHHDFGIVKNIVNDTIIKEEGREGSQTPEIPSQEADEQVQAQEPDEPQEFSDPKDLDEPDDAEEPDDPPLSLRKPLDLSLPDDEAQDFERGKE